MAMDSKRVASELTSIEIASNRLVLPNEIGSKIENFVASPVGTLASVTGPCPYIPDYGAGYFAYGVAHGLFHAYINDSNQEILIAHTGNSVRVFQGANRTWVNLIGPASASPTLEYTLTNDSSPRYPTQFELCPNGILIVPQGGNRAFFYDGECVTLFGYDSPPSAPRGDGPLTTTNANDVGYYGNSAGYALGDLLTAFGDARLGSVEIATTAVTGTLLPGAYWSAYQYIDRWGNLSPLSGYSNVVTWDGEYHATDVDHYRKQVLWSGIENGRQGTIGKVFSRTKDIRNSGTTTLYNVPGNAAGGIGTSGSFATIPDNVTKRFPDNTPDEALVLEALPVLPMPIFKLCRLAFGRIWIAGIKGDQGRLQASYPGRWGTMDPAMVFYPDSSGGEITGLWIVPQGLLVMTERSVFLYVSSEDGLRFKPIPMSKSVGCVAPDTLDNLPDGRVIWLGHGGFYTFDGQSIAPLKPTDIQDDVKRINTARHVQSTGRYDPVSKEYRCYVPYNGTAENAYCFIYDTLRDGWRNRFNVERYAALTLTRGNAPYMLGAGTVTDSGSTSRDGVWVLDHSNGGFAPQNRTYTLETGWLRAPISNIQGSTKRLQLWLRETSATDTVTISVYRDWKRNAVPDDTQTAKLWPSNDVPPAYGVYTLGTAATWQRRRPYWTYADIYIPACEVFKLKISAVAPARIELLGFIWSEIPHPNSGRSPT